MNSIVLSVTLLVSTSSEGAAKKVPYKPNSPVVNLNAWKYDHSIKAFRFNGNEKIIYLDYMNAEQAAFINSMYSVPIDELSIYVNLFQTGCLSWSKNAYKQAEQWNEQNPDSQVSLKKAKK